MKIRHPIGDMVLALTLLGSFFSLYVIEQVAMMTLD